MSKSNYSWLELLKLHFKKRDCAIAKMKTSKFCVKVRNSSIKKTLSLNLLIAITKQLSWIDAALIVIKISCNFQMFDISWPLLCWIKWVSIVVENWSELRVLRHYFFSFVINYFFSFVINLASAKEMSWTSRLN